MAEQPKLPTIVTTDTSQNSPPAPLASSTQGAHARSPSDPNYLTPTGILKPNQQSSLALRENDPEKRSGLSSLKILGGKHGRKGSATSVEGSAEGTEPDHLPGGSASSTVAGSPSTKTKRKQTDDSDEEEKPQVHIDPSTDTTDPTPFAYQPLKLAALLDPKSFEDLKDMGGIDGVVNGLGTDRTNGLSEHSVGLVTGGEKSGGEGAFGASLADRQRVYGINSLPIRKSKTLLQLMWHAFTDKVLILLSVAAAISLALGLYQDFGVKHPPEPCPDDVTRMCIPPRVDFVEGVAIMIAVVIVVLVGSLNDWQKERQFKALNEKKDDRSVKVIRAGKEQQINVKDVLVGDVALMEPGEIIPCDGIFLSGHNVRCDESSATGEADAIKKATYEDTLKDYEANGGQTKLDPFIISGAKVLEGVGSYVVIAVGPRSFNGRIMTALRGDTESTPLQIKLNNLAELIAKIGGTCGLILFTSLMIKFFVQLKTKPGRTANQKAMNFVQNLIISVTLVVVAVPEGLPLAVTLALAFATKRMTYENLLVRVLGSCETMANATVVCTDKTGTLTQNEMSVVAGSIGVTAKFVKNLKDNVSRAENSGAQRRHADDFAIEQDDLDTILSPQLRHIINEGIAVNSTAFEDVNKETGEVEFVGSKTETALLNFAKNLKWPAYRETRANATIVQLLPFASERKYMGVLVKNGDKFRVYFKGASEILTKLCTEYVVAGSPGSKPEGKVGDPIETKAIDNMTKENIANTIIFYANQMLRTIALCYKDVDSWPPPGKDLDEVPLSELANDLTLVGVVGIEDPLRIGVRDAVSDSQRAGVTIKMCTGDNVLTARSIATQCGIYTPGGIIMEGPVFRKLSETERNEVVPHLQVLARSSPEDKKILVETLKAQGQVVGVTGDGTNDGPALKTANVGFSMGIAGTEVAKEASDIILMDDNFASIVSAIMWGRCVNDSVRKFLQFQISVNITAVLITFISAVASDEEESVLTAVQLLWINIIMDTFAALALATDPASRKLLDRKPDPKTAPLFTLDMGKMIIGQALYQTFIVLMFHFAGRSILNLHEESEFVELESAIFNIFVFCQIFNSVNCRRIDNRWNIFEGIHRNWYFIGITLFEVAIQVVIVFVGGAAFSVRPISAKYWGLSIGLGFVSIPLGFLIRQIPNAPLRRLLIHVKLMQDPNALPTTSPDSYNSAIDQIRDNLSTFANLRGGRVRASSVLARRQSKKKMKKDGVQLSNLMTMVPTLVASSVGAGWQPKNNAAIYDPANGDPSRSSAALWDGKLQLHPETPKDHPAWQKWGAFVEKRQ